MYHVLVFILYGYIGNICINIHLYVFGKSSKFGNLLINGHVREYSVYSAHMYGSANGRTITCVGTPTTHSSCTRPSIVVHLPAGEFSVALPEKKRIEFLPVSINPLRRV
jgi:hypothetical protein